ncbi:hypothetical protein JCM16418A_34850 [Paenibacillus pini]
MEAAFPQYIAGSNNDEEMDLHGDHEPDEEDMKRRNAQSKLTKDPEYADRLLKTVMDEPLTEQTMLALEQLSYMEGSAIDQALAEWLQHNELHPLLQFRTLQTLRKRGMGGIVNLTRGQEHVSIEIDSVPLLPEDFPIQMTKITERVAGQTEVQEPTLYYFAQELWSQFIMAIFGTHDYLSILDEDDATIDIWAAALHQMVTESLTGSRNEEESRAMYGITDTMRFRFEQAYRTMKQFVAAGMHE